MIATLKPSEAVVQMLNITKRFPGVLANDDVSITVYPGEVLGLLGENGAGKTTLMNILFGLYQPDQGEIYVDGERVQIRSPHEAIGMGLGMVHQHFTLVRTFTVRENLALGHKISTGFFLDLDEVEFRIRQLSQEYEIPIDPNAEIWQLSVGEQQRIEIINILLQEARILIFDEPTAVLTPQETRSLINTFRLLVNQGKSIVFITHKLAEAMLATDRATVLRRGKAVFTGRTTDTNERELASMMVGREVLFSIPKLPKSRGQALLSVCDLCVKGDRGNPAVDGVSFSIHGGEILGIAGVDGNGQRELCEALVGLRPIDSGSVKIQGISFSRISAKEAIDRGVGYIPEDRQHVGLVLDLPLWRSAVMKRYSEKRFSVWLLMRLKAILSFARQLIAQFSIATPSEKVIVRTLSGGNQQKLVLARELSVEPNILIANQPTRGLDVSATEFVHRILLEQRDAERAILLVSRELDEVLALSDRVAIIYEGKLLDILDVEEAERDRVGALMAGLRET